MIIPSVTLTAQTADVVISTTRVVGSIGFGLLAGLAAGFLLAGALHYRLLVVLSGVLAYPLAWLLDLQLPQRDRVAIFGAQGPGVPLANALKDGGVPVQFIESDPKRSQVAELAGHPAPCARAASSVRRAGRRHRPARAEAVARLERRGWHSQTESGVARPAVL